MLFGVAVVDCSCCTPCLDKLFEIVPAEQLDDRVRAGQAGAAVARMRFDQLALPFRIEQVEIAGRRILGRHQVGVVAHHAERRAPRRVVAFRILELRRVALHVGRGVRREPLLLLPEDEMRGIGRIDDVDVLDARLVLLVDPLEHALRSRALDLDLDIRIFGAKGLGDRLRDLDVDRRIPDDLAFLGGGRQHRGRRLLARAGAAIAQASSTTRQGLDAQFHLIHFMVSSFASVDASTRSSTRARAQR